MTRKFYAVIPVSGQLVRSAPDLVEDLVTRQLETVLGDLRGPRGGRYEPVGDIFGRKSATTSDDFIRDTVSFIAYRFGRYVRPKR